jgi:nucleotide-binding universal stress UspA family protein
MNNGGGNMFKQILLAYDGSEHSRRAAELTGNLAREQKDCVVRIVCAVGAVPWVSSDPMAERWIAEQTLEGNRLIDEASALVGEGVEIRRELVFQSPAEGIMNVAEAHQCDLIVIGSKGRGGITGLLMGSQTQKVISMATCPVLVVK